MTDMFPIKILPIYQPHLQSSLKVLSKKWKLTMSKMIVDFGCSTYSGRRQVFSSPVLMYRKSYFTTHGGSGGGRGIGVDISICICFRKILEFFTLKFLVLEKPLSAELFCMTDVA